MKSSAKQIMWLVVCALGAMVGAVAVAGSAAPAVAAGAAAQVGGSDRPAEDLYRDGLAAFAKGDFEQAVLQWEQASRRFAISGRADRQIDTLLRLAAAYQSLGRYDLAIRSALGDALTLAERTEDRRRLVIVKSSLAAALIYTRQAHRAEPMLKDAMDAAAATLHDDGILAVLWNNMGNLHSAQGQHDEAVADYQKCIALATGAGDRLLAAKASANAAMSAARHGRRQQADDFGAQAGRWLADLPDSHDKVFLLLALGQTDQSLLSGDDPNRAANLKRVHGTFQQALQLAQKLGDKRAQSYALGDLGRLYEVDGRVDDAMQLTVQASFIAQQIQSPELLYRWQWQLGRLLAGMGRRELAIRAYRRAVDTLDTIRHDAAIGLANGTIGATFRQAVGPLYYELADLLLKSADTATDEAEAQRLLLDARRTVELFKSAELTDYFRDDCVNIMRARRRGIETLSPKTAVIYLIPLRDRLEILVSFSTGMARFQSPVSSDELFDEVRLFRQRLETRTTNRYMTQARRLYDWIIRPIGAALTSRSIDTLVFVPDGPLRSVPMAALHDGEQFLVSRYATAVTPGLTLMEPRPLRRQQVEVLLSGISQSVQGYPALPSVPAELSSIARLFEGTKLLDEQFVTRSIQSQIDRQPYTIVHIASHGQFTGEADESYVLTYDDKLTLNGLEQLIRPCQFRGQPIELLTLGACQTAAGDDRSALGLAGVAVKAGARSALATLWYVNDQASSQLISTFYKQLHDHPALSKARALQQAQQSILADPRYSHPCYWSAYLLIGNWL